MVESEFHQLIPMECKKIPMFFLELVKIKINETELLKKISEIKNY